MELIVEYIGNIKPENPKDCMVYYDESLRRPFVFWYNEWCDLEWLNEKLRTIKFLKLIKEDNENCGVFLNECKH